MVRVYTPPKGTTEQYRAIESARFVAMPNCATIYMDRDEWLDLVAQVEAEQAWASGDHATEYTKGAAA